MSNCVANLSESLPRKACECQPSCEISELESSCLEENTQGSSESTLKNPRNSLLSKNPSKKDKGLQACKPIAKTARKRLLMKKTIKKLPKAKREGSPLNLQVSGSTFASNSTPRVSHQIEDFLAEAEGSQLLKPEALAESSQAKINAPFSAGIIAKAILDEVH